MLPTIPPPSPSDLWSLFGESCDKFARREAYQVKGEWITYADLFERVCALSQSFDEIIGRTVAGPTSPAQQPTIVAVLPNDYPLLELFFVAAATRSILLPVNTRLSPSEISRVLAACDPSILVLDSQWRDLLDDLEWPERLHAVVWVGGVRTLPVERRVYSLSYEAMVSAQPIHIGRRYQAVDMADPAAVHVEIFCTSGTTGQPKMVPHSHANVLAHVRMTLDALGLSGEPECWGHFGPMYHVGDVAFVWGGVAIGARHVFYPKPLRFEDVARVISEQEVTITKLVPTMMRFLVRSEVVARLEFPELKWILTGGDKPERELVDRTREIFGCDFIQGYGMTEATCHVAFRNESRFETSGGLRILEGLDVKILDDDGQSVRTEEPGEIAIRGPNVFGGYLNQPEENAARFTADGFFRTGDMGYLNDAHELFVSGRKKDMIIVGGENVFAGDVESVANAIPGIKSSSAIGMADNTFGEVVELAVVLDDPALTEETIINRLRPLLASFKLPRRVHVFDEFPITPTGKIKKHEIRDEISARRTQAAAAMPAGDDAALTVAERVRTVLQDGLGKDFMARCDPDASLLELNLDSLGIATLIVGLEQAFRTELPYWFILEHDSLNALIDFFEQPADQRAALLTRPVETLEPEVEEESEERSRPRPRPARALAVVLLQCAGLLLRPGLAVFSLLPAVWAGAQLLQWFGPGVTFALAPALLFGTTMLAMVYLVLAKWLIVGRLKPGTHEVGTPFYYRWLMIHNLFNATASFLGPYRGTRVLKAFYRLCGAKLARGSHIETLFISEPDLVSVGEETVVERKANLQASLVAHGQLVLAPITIGSHSAIGSGASLGPDTHLDDNTYVPPLAAGQDAARKGVDRPHRPRINGVASTLGFIAISYLCAAALLVSFLAAEALLGVFGIDLALFHFYGPLTDTAIVLGTFALARFGILPIVYFGMVVLVKRGLLKPLAGGVDYAEQGAFRRYGHWLYGRLIDVPFFDWAIQLTTMSALTVIQYRLLGAKIGRRVFFTAPYTTEPELLDVGDEAMIAGNVSLYPANRGVGRVAAIILAPKAAVANSCILHGGTEIGRDSLLGDLSVTPPGFILQSRAIAAGNPPRIVGRTDFASTALRGTRYLMMQTVLVVLQLAFGLGAAVWSWVALTPVIALLDETGPYWWELLTIGPLLLLAPGMFTLAAIPVAKQLLVRRFIPGDYPLFGWLYVRWVLLETLLGRVEENTTSQINGTLFARIFYESMGARVGDSVSLMGSPIGGEFDLKTIGSGASLNHQSKVFAHSIKRHTLFLQPTQIEAEATIRPFAIVEAGATVHAGQVVDEAIAFHAAREASGKSPYEKHYVNLREIEAAAARTLPRSVLEYFAGGAADEMTLHRNENISARYQIVPRVLRDVTIVSTTRRLLDVDLPLPMMVAPMAMQKLVHADGEVGMAKAARLHGIPFVLSCLSTTAMEEVAAAGRRGDLFTLFQFYCLRDRSMVHSLIRRAERAGYRGLVLTVDAPVSGKRERDMRNRFAVSSTIRFPNLEALAESGSFQLARFDGEVDPSLTWDVIQWIRDCTELPLFLKGILSRQDAALAVEQGASGIIVSNHGGRQLDTTPAAIEVLPEIRETVNALGSKLPIYIDGGIRRGTDIFKAIALGADGVLVGRPCVYGLAVDGYPGAARVLTILKEELLQTMRLAGCRSLAEIEPDMVRLADEVQSRKRGTGF
jgi:isopentenyl diphosphate isomerase/L-lactate dehydrogenase-like FMN-dependent dehydrogenase/acyl-CoA synthetase (AMP-forming)/AMP-acid ligase II/acetyltransferase-like isoleucine patch superfamily enzyme/acyl carrier protein